MLNWNAWGMLRERLGNAKQNALKTHSAQRSLLSFFCPVLYFVVSADRQIFLGFEITVMIRYPWSVLSRGKTVYGLLCCSYFPVLIIIYYYCGFIDFELL